MSELKNQDLWSPIEIARDIKVATIKSGLPLGCWDCSKPNEQAYSAAEALLESNDVSDEAIRHMGDLMAQYIARHCGGMITRQESEVVISISKPYCGYHTSE